MDTGQCRLLKIVCQSHLNYFFVFDLFNFCPFVHQVESYVAHIRGLLEERECLTADYERDNEHLRQELHQIRQQQGEFSANVVRCWHSFLWLVA